MERRCALRGWMVDQTGRIRETEMLALAIYFAHDQAANQPLDAVADQVIALLPVDVNPLQRSCAIARAKQRLGK